MYKINRIYAFLVFLLLFFSTSFILFNFKNYKKIYFNNKLKNIKIHFSILADSMQSYNEFVKRNNLLKYNIEFIPFVCSTERGIKQKDYTHNCSMDHSKLNIKSNIIWNNLPTDFEYYFKVDSDVTLDIIELMNQLNYYNGFKKKLVFGKVWRTKKSKFFLSGPFYGTNYPQNYTGDIEAEDVQFSENLPDDVFVVDWSTYYCGNAYPIKNNGACSILVSHGECVYEDWAHCNTYYNYIDYNKLKTIGDIRNSLYN